MTAYSIERVRSRQGTIVVFEAFRLLKHDEMNDARLNAEAESTTYLVAVDHRMARDLIAALDAGDGPIAEVEPWQIVGELR